jgi:pSer/pThr/pTyr-binding forkhead associated (FHA) protein
VYEPRGGTFYIKEGKGENLTYVNEKVVLQPRELNRGDRIQIGETTLLFVPLCDDSFRWGERPE